MRPRFLGGAGGVKGVFKLEKTSNHRVGTGQPSGRQRDDI